MSVKKVKLSELFAFYQALCGLHEKSLDNIVEEGEDNKYAKIFIARIAFEEFFNTCNTEVEVPESLRAKIALIAGDVILQAVL